MNKAYCVSALCVAHVCPSFKVTFCVLVKLCQLFEKMSGFVEFILNFLDYVHLYGPDSV